jgi:multiple sugar transport system substrate-binding protein
MLRAGGQRPRKEDCNVAPAEPIGRHTSQTRRSALRTGAQLAAGGAVAALAPACGAGGDAKPAQDAAPATVSYVTDWSSGTRGEWLKAAVPRFMEEHPKIRLDVANWAGNVAVTTLANAAAGTLQDVMLNGADVFLQLVRNGNMKDITPALKTLRVNMNDLLHVDTAIKVGDKQYGMPFQFTVITPIVNKTMYQRAGVPLPTEKTTYPQLLEGLQKIARPTENVFGFETSGSAGDWNKWMMFAWAYGGERWTPDLKKTLLDTPGSIEGLQFYVDMMYRHRVATPLDEKGSIPSGVSFASGNLAISSNGAPGAATTNAVAGRFEWDVIHHPLGPKTGKRRVAGGDQANVVTEMATKRGVFEQAVQFAVWCSAGKTAQELVVDVSPNCVPVLKSVLNGKYLATPPANKKIVVDMTKDLVDPGWFVGFLDWRNAVVAELLPAFTNTKSVPDAAREAARAGDAVLAKVQR